MAVDIDCVVDARAGTGECPLWDPREQVLWWIDIPAGALHRYDPSSGENRRYVIPAAIGSIALCKVGGLLVALKTGLFTFEPRSRRLERVASPPFDHPDDRFNDGRCDRQGRFWVSSMRDPQDPEARAGHFFRFDPRNGFRPLIGDGCYWIAANSGAQLVRYTPDGRIDRQVPLPVQRPTMPAFGNRELDVLYITSQTPRPGEEAKGQPRAGGLFALKVGVKGLPEVAFRG